MIFYKSKRIGKGGKPFNMLKFRTLKEGADKSSFAEQYVWGGKFLRKYRIDEFPQFLNLLKGDMRIVGIRPLEERTYNLYPQDIRKKLTSIKPGWFSLSGIYFIDEEQILKLADDPHKEYWEKILPMKLTLDFFYLENRCLSLSLWIIYQGIKKALKQICT